MCDETALYTLPSAAVSGCEELTEAFGSTVAAPMSLNQTGIVDDSAWLDSELKGQETDQCGLHAFRVLSFNVKGQKVLPVQSSHIAIAPYSTNARETADDAHGAPTLLISSGMCKSEAQPVK